ncbi:diguanylate cyclase [Rhodoferax sp.]|uniref:diguanylate cyclase n=1 Tax=Rhodoferax sp. TaxID=50421 RepID=UPI00262C0A72|nr:diguanylate cyclase [Rhodoferax sp.]MDD2926007.1 diguanylate cyclase [Rhodoferax sp.]
MPKISPERLTQEWEYLLTSQTETVRQRVQTLASLHQEALATYFYDHMLADPTASQFLSHHQVQDRLHRSMQRWVESLFSAQTVDALAPLIAQQVQIGEVHARIGIPVHLVLRGARRLKERFSEVIHADDTLGTANSYMASRFVANVIDTSMEIMSQAYSGSHDRQSRSEEAYRLFSISQHVGAERERQKAALLAWENQMMFEQAVGTDAAQLPRISTSEFGLWFRHKGLHAFHGSPEAGLIMDAIDHIDEVLLPVFALVRPDSQADRIRQMRELHEATKGIAYHLDNLFEQNNELEAGRDALTRLLNRKYLPVVMSKEVHFARKRKSSFALLALDIDHFKLVNDTHGHEGGDAVLQQLGLILNNTCRGGDYIFRMGGEEFLMLLVDVGSASAMMVAQKLRHQVEHEIFRLPLDKSLKLTISIGLTMYNGHPDYQHTLRLADDALYQAKREGRNRVVYLDS